MSVVVRRLQRQDLPGVLRLLAQLQPDDPRVEPSVLERTWQRITRDPALIHVGVLLQDELVAMCHAAVIPNLSRGARPYAVIENVVSDSAHQRCGYGKLAMRTLIAQCWQRRCYKIMLMSGSARASVHGFYDALGFDRQAKQAFVLKAPS